MIDSLESQLCDLEHETWLQQRWILQVRPTPRGDNILGEEDDVVKPESSSNGGFFIFPSPDTGRARTASCSPQNALNKYKGETVRELDVVINDPSGPSLTPLSHFFKQKSLKE